MPKVNANSGHPNIPALDPSSAAGFNDDSIKRFTLEAQNCFESIGKSALSLSDKYRCLGELRDSIKVLKSHDREKYKGSELSELAATIYEARKGFKREFKTNSHWLVGTANGRHMQAIRPSLRRTPTVTLSLNDIRTSLNNIAKLETGIEKIRALQHFNQMAVDSLTKVDEELAGNSDVEAVQKKKPLIDQRNYLLGAIEQITKFGDIALTFAEKISLLLQIESWDNDPIQQVQLKSLVDRFGKDYALHLMSREGMNVDTLVHSLKVLLREVYQKNPALSLLDIVKKWPLTIDSHRFEIPGLELKTLLALAEDPVILKDPVAGAVIEYLLIFLDGTGELRFEEWHT